MAMNYEEDTEFNDALRKHGIIPPREPPPASPSPPPSPTFDDLLDGFTPKDLQEIADDAPDDDTQRVVEAFRRQRLADDRREEKRARFGRVYPIGREDYTREVTEASQVHEEDDDDETGTGVVCLLYKDGIPRSERTFQQIRTLAQRYPRTKFVSIVGDKCIPNLPDSRIPMLIVYKNGEIKNQVVAWGADRDRRVEELEALLMVTDAIHIPERNPNNQSRDEDSNSEDEVDDDPSSRMRSSQTATNGRGQRNIRGKEEDSDSDFDL